MPLDSTRVLVTGASGFIGRELCRQLVSAAARVKALCRKSSCAAFKQEFPSIEVIEGDLQNPETLSNACRGADIIFHLAGIAHVRGVHPDKLYQSHVIGSQNLLQVAIAEQVPRLIYFSSSLAGADSRTSRNAYVTAKLAAEKLLMRAHTEGRLQLCILRPVNVYGPGMQGGLKTLIDLIKNHRLPALPALQSRLALVGVRDLCRLAIQASNSESVWGNTYTVCDGKNYTVSELETSIYEALGRKKPRWHLPLMLLYAAALAGETAARLTGKTAIPGLGTYKNLVSGNQISGPNLGEQPGFEITNNFYDELPTIINAMSALPRE